MPNKKDLQGDPPATRGPLSSGSFPRGGRLESRRARRKADVIIGASNAILEVHRLIDLVAARAVDVLITGESGTGKELVARTIHAQSERADGPFIVVNCEAIPPELVEHELFGGVNVTLATESSKQGLAHAATNGTLFLQNVTALLPAVQSKLARTIVEREYRTKGHQRPLRVEARMILATNRDLTRAVRQGELSRELFYRLKDFVIGVPALRHRREDISLLVEHFVRSLREELAHDVERFSSAAIAALMQRPWPGNVRDLFNCVRTTVASARVAVVEPEHLFFPPEVGGGLPGDALELGYAELRRRTLARFEADFIARALKAAGGNISLAARIAKVDRKHMWRLMKRAKLSRAIDEDE